MPWPASDVQQPAVGGPWQHFARANFKFRLPSKLKDFDETTAAALAQTLECRRCGRYAGGEVWSA